MITRFNIQPFCECNCGELVTWSKWSNGWNRFIKGHSRKGRRYVMSEEHKAKIKATCSTPEAREKNSILQKIAQNRIEISERKSQVMKVICNTVSARKRNSIAQNKPETKKKRSLSLIIANKRPEVIERRSRASKIAQNRPEVKEKRIKATKLYWKIPGIREERSLISKIAHNTVEAKENHSQAMLKRWLDLESARMIRASQGIRPNKPENFILFLLNRMYPGEWKYTGDFSFMIGGKNPDFVNVNGYKKCIEFNGTYWHKGDLKGKRERIFAKYGWDTLVIWDHELKDIERVKFRINKFQRKEGISVNTV